jgi:hypothetical protein
MSYNRNKQGKSGIVDFRQAYIQNLEDTAVLPRFRGEAGQIHWPIRHTEARPKVL